jgi:MtN3 and saliva related transmembrane protein
MLLILLRQAGTEDILISLIGVAAAVLTTSSFVPQIIKGYRTKSMDDVSRYLMSLFATGTVLWMVYGIYKSDWVIIVANATATAFNVILLCLKFSYRKSPG